MSASGDVLLVCSGGGHLRQLDGWAQRLGIEPERQVWATFRNGLSESLLAGRRIEYVPYTAPRDLPNFARVAREAWRIVRGGNFSAALSTGSSPAVGFLPLATLMGIPCYYIESAARADGPSLTGRMIARFPSIRTFCQYPGWADSRWLYRGSIFDGFEPVAPSGSGSPRRAVVTVGTQVGYPFTRLFEKVAPLLTDFDEVLYQTGDADVSRLGITGIEAIPHTDLQQAMRQADVVITHGGVGAALTAFSAGKHPIMVPRSVEHAEHIDDHQVQVARELHRRRLATLRFVDSLEPQDLVHVSRQSVRVVAPPPLALDFRRTADVPRL